MTPDSLTPLYTGPGVGTTPQSSDPVYFSDGVPVYRRRFVVARTGNWRHPATGKPVTLTRARLAEWQANTTALIAAGVYPFVPTRHVDKPDARDNVGRVTALDLEGDDLYATVELFGDAARKLAAVNGRSVYVDRDARDATGKVYPGESLSHLAICPDPALPALGGVLAASRSFPALLHEGYVCDELQRMRDARAAVEADADKPAPVALARRHAEPTEEEQIEEGRRRGRRMNGE